MTGRADGSVPAGGAGHHQPFPGWHVQAAGWTAQRIVDGEPRGAVYKAATLDALAELIGTPAASEHDGEECTS